MNRNALSPSAAIRAARPLLEQLGAADRSRLESLFGLVGADGAIPLGAALAALFPGVSREAALTAFRQFRGRIRDAAAEVSVNFSLDADGKTRTAPEKRVCWFAGDNSVVQELTAVGNMETAGVRRGAQDILEPTEMRDDKPVVRYFVSFAHEDMKLKNDLMKLLRVQLKTSAAYYYECWEDRDIALGEPWHAQIQHAIARCHFGLLLVSPAFLASDYIRKNELPQFVSDDPSSPVSGKRAIPVALKPIRFDEDVDTKGLKHIQVFHDNDRKAFSERATSRRDAFVDNLFSQIVKVTAKLVSQPLVSSTPRRDFDKYLRHTVASLDDLCLVSTEGHVSTLDKDADAVEPGERRDALVFLKDWLNNPEAQPYCALLGEYGMGKTTTCMALTRDLLDERRDDLGVPLPIYLDLRHVGDAARKEPDLMQILETVLRRMWQGGQTKAHVTAEEVVQLVREQGALAIFDGLDEVLVHLTPSEGQRFAREIFRTLPPNLMAGHAKTGAERKVGRLLVSCRTHYFRTVRDQKTYLTAEGRDGVGKELYRVFILMPFNEDQIKTYLTQTLPGEDPDRVLEVVRAVHNLSEMAERPYTLSLIANHLPAIERWKMEGRQVTGVDLYRRMVLSWLERDTGKHQLTPDHKQELMEYFAAALHRSGKRSWTVGDVEQWLMDVLRTRPEMAAHYEGKDRDLLKEDLRTATFLVGHGEAEFRFAHSSLQEYFLASYLYRALVEGRIENWDMAKPSIETLDFLGQLVIGGERDLALATLRLMRDGYRPKISEMAFTFFLHAYEKNYPIPSLAGFRLEGADLRSLSIAGKDGEPPLNLRGASFCRARMENAELLRVDLTGSDFAEANLTRAEFCDGRAHAAKFQDADLTGTLFRHFELGEADFTDVRLHRTQWLHCADMPVSTRKHEPPAAFFVPDELMFDAGSLRLPRWAILDGHNGAVASCAFSYDGRLLASVSYDGTVRLWDVHSGETLKVLRGHEGSVTSCAFSPDGRRLASTSVDRTVRVWDAASGKAVAVLRGHEGSVKSCAFSPDGRRLASTSGDQTVRVWNAASGEIVAVLRGHEGSVTSCAFSPDGRHLASASGDQTVRVWDGASGETAAILRGHEDSVTSCAFSPDGRHLASASDDQTVRVWNAASGEAVAVLRGHERWITSCAFSPDGRRLASASNDRTVRLWDAASGEAGAVLRGHGGSVKNCVFSPDGRHLASASDDLMVRLWDAASGEAVTVLRGHESWVTSCAFSPDERCLASASDDLTVRLWDAASGEAVAVLPGHQGWITSCAFSPDGRHLASTSNDRTVRLWDAASGEAVTVLRGHEGSVNSCAFSPDGRRLASASEDLTVRLWDAASGEAVAVLRGHEDSVTTCAFSADGRRLASASEDLTVRLWDAASGEAVAVLRGHEDSVTSCAFSADGRRLASVSHDRTVRLWDAASGEAVAVLRGHEISVTSCAFSPNGRRLVSASYDRTVRLWDVASGEPVTVLRGHEKAVMSCAFSPDGRRLASASYDGSVCLWDLEAEGEVRLRIQHFRDGSWAVLDVANNRIVEAAGEAWRWIGLMVTDPSSGAVTRYPAETLGPLPAPRLLR